MVAESWLWDVDAGKWEQGTVTLAAFRRPSCHPGQSPLYSVGGIRVSTQGNRSFGGRRHSWRGRDEGGWLGSWGDCGVRLGGSAVEAECRRLTQGAFTM